MNNGIYAKFTTSKGEILVRLEDEKKHPEPLVTLLLCLKEI